MTGRIEGKPLIGQYIDMRTRCCIVLTGFLLLQSQLMPVDLHPIPQCHPQIRLLLGVHLFPSLLDAGQSRVGDRVLSTGLT